MPNISYEEFKRQLNSANSYNKTEFRLHLMKEIKRRTGPKFYKQYQKGMISGKVDVLNFHFL